MTLGEKIARLRARQGMSQGTLAEELGVSRQSVSKWETDASVPELDKLVKMAQLFGVSLDELVTGNTASTQKSDPVTGPAEIPVPPAAPEQAAPVKQALSHQQILGVVLLAFGGLCLIVFTVVGIFTGLWLLGLFIGLPFLLCGAICLLCKKNVGLKCAWAVFVPLWILLTVIMVR